MSDSENEIHLLKNEREINRLINKFDQAANLRDMALFKSLWTPDAVWEISKPLYSKADGIAEIMKMIERLFEPQDFFFRTTQSPLIEFHANGHSATSISPTIEIARNHEGKSYANVAHYKDEYRKLNGQWLFSGRHYEYIWVETELPLTGKSISRRKET